MLGASDAISTFIGKKNSNFTRIDVSRTFQWQTFMAIKNYFI